MFSRVTAEVKQALPSTWVVFDAGDEALTQELLYPFAFDEVYCREIAAGAPAAVHIWRQSRGFVMGLRDRRLPDACKAMSSLQQDGYTVAVRNSGGAAVPLDDGVVNISLLLPALPGAIQLQHDFATMRELIFNVLRRRTHRALQQGEVQGSYCPGEFDLSIGGRKFCGIAQRRKLQAFAVQAFVVVEGKGRRRAETARLFYRLAAGNADPSTYPEVRPEMMASLSEFIGDLTSARFITEFIHTLAEQSTVMVRQGYPTAMQEDIQAEIRNMKARYDPE